MMNRKMIQPPRLPPEPHIFASLCTEGDASIFQHNCLIWDTLLSSVYKFSAFVDDVNTWGYGPVDATLIVVQPR